MKSLQCLTAVLLCAGAVAGARAATTYSGIAAFGGTVSVTVDAPSAGKLTLRFDESPFGLAGSAVSSYTLTKGQYTARHFESDSSNPVSDAMKLRLSRVQLTFRASGESLSGDIARLWNQGARTAAQMAANS